jgi:A/G-specific adenine glycosylase
MLQQTQVNQVIPYYQKFIAAFPDVYTLAAASQQQVLKIWEGMGYYARARNLHRAARLLVDNHNGEIPPEKSILLKIPGFGPYISNAVLSLAYQKPLGVVDGNVIRVIARVFGIKDDIRLGPTRKKIYQIVQHLLDTAYPGDFNEALMEIGATLCLPKKTECQACPFNRWCIAKNLSLTGKIPYKSAKAQKPVKKAAALILTRNDKVLIVRRNEHGLLGGLWEFPFLNDYVNSSDINPVNIQKKYIDRLTFKKAWPPIRHSYTHFNLELCPQWYICPVENIIFDDYGEYKWVFWKEITHFPTHRAMQKVLQLVGQDSEIVSQGQIKDAIL